MIALQQPQSSLPARPTTSMKGAHGRTATSTNAAPLQLPTTINPLFLAMSAYRRHQYQRCIALCSHQLSIEPRDTAAHLLKTKALTAMNITDDTDVDDENIADMMLDEHQMTAAARPGTSFKQVRGATGSGSDGRPNRSITTASGGRPPSGFVRPATRASASRAGGRDAVKTALSGQRPMTGSNSINRPVSHAGRNIRLGTQSMLNVSGNTGEHIDPNRIDIQKYNTNNRYKQQEAKLLVLYLLHHTHTPKVALELAAICTTACNYTDVVWKSLLGRIYYALGMYREAEEQWNSTLKHNEYYITTYLYLSKLHCKLDQPNTALEILERGLSKFHGETSLQIAIARIHEQLQNTDKSILMYRNILQTNAMSVEALACIANYYFYHMDAPEIALRYFSRLVQLGVDGSEIWNNIGLCAFYSNQYDLSLNAMFRSLQLADEETTTTSDIWYNLSLVGIGIGDTQLAMQCLRITLSMEPNHWEAWNNIGILELRKGNIDAAKSAFTQSAKLSAGAQGYEGSYNGALLASKLGDMEQSYQLVNKSIAINPQHSDSHEHLKTLKKSFEAI